MSEEEKSSHATQLMNSWF